jgi:hypothetical protein
LGELLFQHDPSVEQFPLLEGQVGEEFRAGLSEYPLSTIHLIVNCGRALL